MQNPLFPQIVDDASTRTEVLAALNRRLQVCVKCELAQTRILPVFGEGPIDASVAFVGEAPGAQEDESGRPFVGRAGKLLDDMIRAIGLARSECYVMNVVCCRPPNNRRPIKNELKTCRMYAATQLSNVKPKIIVALGATAAQSLLASSRGVHDLRHGVHEWEGIPLKVTFHPAFLLRMPAMKHEAWKDLCEVVGILKNSAGKQ